ncbi:MAG: hypothetical protein KC502_07530 [Myxococcales bacterium]|nr:hypothetical protein [Myxococcales bacterium]
MTPNRLTQTNKITAVVRRSRQLAIAPVAAALMIGLLATGCISKVTGNEGNLTFQYPADDQLLDFNKAIAVGAKLDLVVREVGSSKLVELTGATSSDDKALTVESFQGNKLILKGTGNGTATIEVTAKQADGTTVTDSVNMRARTAEVLKMRHYCTSDTIGHYLASQDVLIPFDLELKDGQPVIGYGFAPVSLEPADGVTFDQTTKAQVHFHVRTSDKPQTVTLSSTIDSTKLKMQIHTQADIDGAMMDSTSDQALVGLTRFALVRPTIGKIPVCQANAEFTAESTTEDVCTIKALTAKRAGVDAGWGWIEIKGKKPGKCNFNVSHPKGKDGKGVVTPFSLSIVSAP